MNVLLLEDRGSISKYLSFQLSDEGFRVVELDTILDGLGFFQYNEEDAANLDCLIVDLNLDPRGLTDDQILESEAGLLAGWIWLKYHVIPKYPHYRNRIILLTDYKDALIKRESSENLRGINIIAKRPGSESGTATILLKKLEAITTR